MIESDALIYCDDHAQVCGILGPVGLTAGTDGEPEPVLRIVYFDGTFGTVPASSLMLRPQPAAEQ